MADQAGPIDGGYGEMTFTARGTITKGYFVEYDSTGAGGVKVLAAAGNPTLGIALEAASAGEKVTIATRGRFRATCTTAATIDECNEIFPGVTGGIEDDPTGGTACGLVTQEAAATGATAYFYLVASQLLARGA